MPIRKEEVLQALDDLIEAQETRVKALSTAKHSPAREQYPVAKADLAAIKRTREIIAGTSVKMLGDELIAKLPISKAVEWLLKDSQQMHVDNIVSKLEEAGRNVNKQTVTSVLLRDAQKGIRFKKVGKNTFALLDRERDS
jgi:hypothetical protein